jgi:putative ABC transport system permease protein
MRYQHHSQRLAILGLPADTTLFRLFDDSRGMIDSPHNGLIISKKLAELLGARKGDVISVEVLEGFRPTDEVVVSGLIRDYAGLNAYMNVNELHRMMREGDSVSGAFLQVDAVHQESLFQKLKATPRIAGVTVKSAAVKSFRNSIGETLRPMRISNMIFASIIAFGVVYNTARISLAERSRELATLRVLGYTKAEISRILLGELAVLTMAAMPLGMAIGYAFSALTANSFDFDVYRIPLIVNRSTYATAAVVTLIAASVSALVVRNRINRLDLIAVLKSRE